MSFPVEEGDDSEHEGSQEERESGENGHTRQPGQQQQQGWEGRWGIWRWSSSRVQPPAVVGGFMDLMQKGRLAQVDEGGVDTGVEQGLTPTAAVDGEVSCCSPPAAAPPSLIRASVRSSRRCCHACACTLLVLHALSWRAHQHLLLHLDHLTYKLHLPGTGRDLAAWLATLLLGCLVYHWTLGLLLLPLLGAATASAFFWLLPISRGGHTLLPLKSAGLVAAVAGGALILVLGGGASGGVLGAVSGGLRRGVLQVLPHSAQLLGVLLLGQVTAEVWEGGCKSEAESAFLLLVLRVWLLAAAAWLGGWGAAAALAPVLQKAFILHQCGALVRSVRMWYQKQYGQHSIVLADAAETHRDQGLLLLLLSAGVLFLPPLAMAPLRVLPWQMRELAVWGFRVLGCGFALRSSAALAWRTAEAAAAVGAAAGDGADGAAASIPTSWRGWSSGAVNPSMNPPLLLDKALLLHLLKGYWAVLGPLVLVVGGDTFLCAAAPAARGELQAAASGLLQGLLALELLQLVWGEVQQARQMVKVALAPAVAVNGGGGCY